MAVQLLESLTAAGFGAADAAISAKVTQRLPGGIPAGAALEAAGVLVGMFGQKFGLGADIRDPVMISALALAGHRATQLAMSGKLLSNPATWPAVGGEGGHNTATIVPSVRAISTGRNWAPGIRRLGMGGLGTDLYPSAYEQGGVAS